MKRLPIVLSIPHVLGRPERESAFLRLKDSLGMPDSTCPASAYIEYNNLALDRPRNRLLRETALATGFDYCLFLEDDLLVAPNFWDVIAAIIEGAPGRPIGFHTRTPDAKWLLGEGRHWSSSVELVGTAYMFPREVLAEVLAWEDKRPKAHFVTSDTLIGVWAYAEKKRIYHPIPTIIDHDNSLASTTASPVLEGRNPTVTWRSAGVSSEAMIDPEFWRIPHEEIVPHHVLPYACLAEDLGCAP